MAHINFGYEQNAEQNKMKKSQNTGDIFWRNKINEDVIDLREIAKKKKQADLVGDDLNYRQSEGNNFKKTKEPSSLISKNIFADADEEIPQYFAALKKYKMKSAGALSKDVIEEELSKIDVEDLQLQPPKSQAPQLTTYGLNQYNIIPHTKDRVEKPDIKQSQVDKDWLMPTSRRQQKKIRKKILKDSSTVSASQIMGVKGSTNKPNKPKPKPKKFKKTLLFACFVFFVAGAPFLTLKAYTFKDDAELHGRAAYNLMLEGKEALIGLDPTTAKDKFQQAQYELEKIEKNLGFLPVDIVSLFASLPTQSRVGSSARVLRAGKLFSISGYQISHALALLQGLPEFGSSPNEQGAFTDNLIKAGASLEQAQLNLQSAKAELAFIRPQDVPDNFRDGILAVQQQGLEIEHIFEQTFSSIDVLLAFLGHQSPKNYLLAFQNSSELRATGGFMGTYGILELNKGHVQDLFIDGIYNPDGQLAVNVIPPSPLQYVTPNWGTRDSNWFFDFPTSAEKMMWFYEKTGGVDTDGVIALTPRVVERLLDLTGSIDMPEYGLELAADNFLELVQQEVEVDYDKELNAPKQILTDFAPIFIEKLKNVDSQIAIFNILLDSLNNKDIQIYSKDDVVQDFVVNMGWSGEVALTNKNEDYLAVVISNIGGWKTDKYTQTEVDTVTTITNDGEILRSVILSRKHEGGLTPYVWYNKPNNAYIRFYIPSGSELISAEGFSIQPNYIKTNYGVQEYIEDVLVSAIENNKRTDSSSGTDIFEESNKTVFGNWLQVRAGDRKIVKITYKLPFKITQSATKYSLSLQKQSGIDIKYSGTVEEFHNNLSIPFCSLNKDKNFAGGFEFNLNRDTKITCGLVQ